MQWTWDKFARENKIIIVDIGSEATGIETQNDAERYRAFEEKNIDGWIAE